MRAEAEEQLAHYEEKLAQMEAEMDRIKVEMKEQAEADRAKIVREAKERRAQIEAEARTMIEQQLAHARHDATVKAVSRALAAAREQIKKALEPADHTRLSADLIASIESKLQSKGAEP
jgi:F0F1-type ATP synthase membrane subunit b/b'